MLILLLVLLLACSPGIPAAPSPEPVMLSQRPFPGLSIRVGDKIVDAPADLQALARAYTDWPDKGAELAGRRISVNAPKLQIARGETVSVVHVAEITRPGQVLYIMGPKPIVGEWVDGRLATPPSTGADPLVPDLYDGVTFPSPGVDWGYDVTTWRFDTPGTHRIQWRLGYLESNELKIEVTP